MRRAYSFISVKSLDAPQRAFTGMATSPVTDRMGDVIEPMGVQFKNPLPLLLYHDSKKPVGEVRFLRPTPDGVPFDAQLSTIDRPGVVQDRLNEAWDSLSADPPLIKAVSIGFRELEPPTYIKETGGYNYSSIEVLELSMVVIPANQAALIETVKSFDRGVPATDVKGAVAPHSTATTDVAWNGPAAMANLPSPLPVAKARAACAWIDDSQIADGTLPKGAAKFVHHEVSADGSVGAANLVACSAGIAVLNGGRGGSSIPDADRQGVYAHLARHLKDAGRTPPELKAFSTTPGVSGASRVKRTERTMKKSYADQIKEWEATRQAKTARMDELLTKAGETGETMDEAETQEHDGLEAEVTKIDAQLVRLRAAEARAKADAVAVKGDTTEDGQASRDLGRTIVSIKRNVGPGIPFARYAMCMGASRGIPAEAMRLAKQHYKDEPGVLALVEKTAVAGGTTAGSHWLDDMVPYAVMQDFIEFLRPGSIIGKFGGPNPGAPGRNYPSLNRVGFNERVSGMSTGFTAGWVGEGLPALPSAAVTFNTSLLFNKLAALAVLSKEAIRFSNPSAEARVRDDLARAVNAKLDVDFIDPAKAVSGTTSPASITNGVVAQAASGTAATNVRHDIAGLLALFAQNNLTGSDIVLIMSATIAAQISMMTNTLGNPDFPGMTLDGGILSGLQVIVSEHLTSLGSPSTQMLVAVKASEVYLADDGVVTVEASDQASLEMVDTSSQSAVSGTGASLVSLWQTGAVGLMAQREITWKKRRSTAAQYISPVAYAVPTS